MDVSPLSPEGPCARDHSLNPKHLARRVQEQEATHSPCAGPLGEVLANGFFPRLQGPQEKHANSAGRPGLSQAPSAKRNTKSQRQQVTWCLTQLRDFQLSKPRTSTINCPSFNCLIKNKDSDLQKGVEFLYFKQTNKNTNSPGHMAQLAGASSCIPKSCGFDSSQGTNLGFRFNLW